MRINKKKDKETPVDEVMDECMWWIDINNIINCSEILSIRAFNVNEAYEVNRNCYENDKIIWFYLHVFASQNY
jgi:hypothetical protein